MLSKHILLCVDITFPPPEAKSDRKNVGFYGEKLNASMPLTIDAKILSLSPHA